MVRDITAGQLTGGLLGSTEVSFHPGRIQGGEYSADTRSAGAVCLLAQVALPCAIYAPSKVFLNLKGGTNTNMAPQIDEFTKVFLPNIAKFGFKFDFEVVRKGFFPKGGGEVNFSLSPVHQLAAIDMTEVGEVMEVRGWSFSAGSLPVTVAERMATACRFHLAGADCRALQGVNVDIETYREEHGAAAGSGCGIVLVAKTSSGCVLGGSALGSPRVAPEVAGRRAAEELIEAVESGGCVDKYVQDQMIIFMALASGESKLVCGPLTLHTRTAIHVAKRITGAKFQVSPSPGTHNSWLISCSGIGLRNPSVSIEKP